jgi:phosphomannomutase
MAEFLEIARKYVEWDPDEETREIVRSCLENNEETKLRQMLSKRIQFGTAGLRSAMGPGYDKMNDLVVLQTCQGIVRYLERTVENSKEKVISIFQSSSSNFQNFQLGNSHWL